ncbi:hypothetical protein LguiA_033127 [Lonicera macranthoides]
MAERIAQQDARIAEQEARHKAELEAMEERVRDLVLSMMANVPTGGAIAKDTKSTISSMKNDEARSRILRSIGPINIDKVPGNLRTINKDAYSPRVVSIGPFHYERLHSKFIVYKNKCRFRYMQVSEVNVDNIAFFAVQHEDGCRYNHYRDATPNTINH